jgi:hypothetical protein
MKEIIAQIRALDDEGLRAQLAAALAMECHDAAEEKTRERIVDWHYLVWFERRGLAGDDRFPARRRRGATKAELAAWQRRLQFEADSKWVPPESFGVPANVWRMRKDKRFHTFLANACGGLL